MLDQRYILFYSKYSRPCRPILEKLALRSTVLTSVCIDNKAVRARIEKDTKISLKVVPTILIVYKTGVVEKYEGDRASELLTEMYPDPQPIVPQYTNEVPPITSVETVVQNVSPAPVPSPVSAPVAEPAKTPVADVTQPTEVAVDAPPKEKPIEATSLLDLDDLPESTEEEPALADAQQQETGRRDQGDNLPIKPDSKVASAAAQMQEERAAMDESLKRGPGGRPK